MGVLLYNIVSSEVVMRVQEALELLDVFLLKHGLHRDFIICGGASIILQGLSNRPTMDIDVVSPQIDQQLKSISIFVADILGLRHGWLNSNASVFVDDFEPGWESRVEQIFVGQNLEVFTVSRQDLLLSKFCAELDRGFDLEDIKSLAPTPQELSQIQTLLLKKQRWEDWEILQLVETIREILYETE